MQRLPTELLSQARRENMKALDEEMRGAVIGSSVGERIECPRCHYTSRKNKFSCVRFDEAIKCFSCGLWRMI